MDLDTHFDRLRSLWDDPENRWGEALGSIVATGDRRAVKPLLLIWPFREDDDYLDWMYAVIHAVESFPIDVYVPELVEAIPEVAASSRYFLAFLLGRILNSNEYFPALMRELQRQPVDARRIAIEVLKEKWGADYKGRSVTAGNWQTLLSLL